MTMMLRLRIVGGGNEKMRPGWERPGLAMADLPWTVRWSRWCFCWTDADNDNVVLVVLVIIYLWQLFLMFWNFTTATRDQPNNYLINPIFTLQSNIYPEIQYLLKITPQSPDKPKLRLLFGEGGVSSQQWQNNVFAIFWNLTNPKKYG